MIVGSAIVAVGVAGALIAEWRGSDSLRRVFKPIASAGFLLAALRAPAFELPVGTGWLLLAGLAFSALGDAALLGHGTRALIGGIGAFSLAHVAYGAWFLAASPPWWMLVIAAVALLAVGHLAWLWLSAHVTGALRVPVRGYVALISLMAACAVAYGAHMLSGGRPANGGDTLQALAPAAGALLFYASDFAVARNRFVHPGFINRAWGLPVYYAAQLLIASAVI